MGGAEGSQAQDFLRKAKAVVICPNIFRAGFFFGGEGGGCVLSARTDDGSWSYPAFYTLGSGSFGLQIGVQSAEVMMIIMTDGGLNALLNSQFKFGADAGLSVATLGAGVNGSMSTALNADIISFSKSEGLYGGVSLSGSVLSDNSGYEQTLLRHRAGCTGYRGQRPGLERRRQPAAHHARALRAGPGAVRLSGFCDSSGRGHVPRLNVHSLATRTRSQYCVQ